jgi:hypothetical protein
MDTQIKDLSTDLESKLARAKEIVAKGSTKNYTPEEAEFMDDLRTKTELRKKLKRRKLLRKKLSIKKTGFFNGLMGGLLGRSSRKAKKLRKARKLRKLRKLRKNKKRRAKSGKRSAIGGGALYALKTVATGAAIQLGAEAAKRALAM